MKLGLNGTIDEDRKSSYCGLGLGTEIVWKKCL